MDFIKNMNQRWSGFMMSLERCTLPILFLLISTVLYTVMIQTNEEHFSIFFYVCLIGAASIVVVHPIYEPFLTKHLKRVFLMGVAILVTIGYYFVIHQPDYFNIEMSTKSIVFLFALLIVFIWIPSVNQDIAFHESFMAAFKAF